MKHLQGPPIKSFYGGFTSQMPEPVQVNLPGGTQGHRPGIGGPQETLLGGSFYSGTRPHALPLIEVSSASTPRA